MCFFGGPPEDNSAALARQAEEERQGRITQGTGQVNQTFSKFDDSFFDGVSKASNDFFLPQVQDQFEAARRKLVLGLGGRGTLNGSSGARQLGDLTKSFETQNASFANRGIDAANQLRGNVESSRTELLNQLNASANPEASATSAIARARLLSTPQTFSPIGQLFADFSSQAKTGLAAEAGGFPGLRTGAFRPGSSSTGGSQTIVRS